jgi:hypothetical protein
MYHAKTYGCDPEQVGGILALRFDAEGRLVGVEVHGATAKLPREILAPDEEPNRDSPRQKSDKVRRTPALKQESESGVVAAASALVPGALGVQPMHGGLAAMDTLANRVSG